MLTKNDILPFMLASASTATVIGIGYGGVKIFNFAVADRTSVSTTSFSAPKIVPVGISVSINGVESMKQVNQDLQKSFQTEFPGTTVKIDTEGSEAALTLLLSGKIDLAAIARPLSTKEKALGLAAVTLDRTNSDSDPKTLAYVYRQPASFRVETFLGHVLSFQGQAAIDKTLQQQQ